MVYQEWVSLFDSTMLIGKEMREVVKKNKMAVSANLYSIIVSRQSCHQEERT